MNLKLVMLPVAGLLSLALVKYLNPNINLLRLTGSQLRFGTCAKLVNVEILSCCTSMDFQWPSQEYMKAAMAIIDECGQDDITQCLPDKCIADKFDLLNKENGEKSNAMNTTAMEDLILDHWPDSPDNYVKTCVTGSVDNYDDTPDQSLCALMRTRRCLVAQTIIQGCASYDTKTNPALCSDVKYLADHCGDDVFPSQFLTKKRLESLES